MCKENKGFIQRIGTRFGKAGVLTFTAVALFGATACGGARVRRMDTKEVKDPAAARDEYHLRTGIEERHRQLKCFWDLTKFQSQALSLIVNQVIFVALAYSLLQLYLRRTDRSELNRRTLPRLRQQLMPTQSVIILYYQNRFALLSVVQYTQLLLSLGAKARRKVLAKTRQIEREQTQEFALVRAP